MRLGRIPWINCYPVYGAIDRGLVPCDAEVVSGTASDLNDLMAAGELDLSVVSAVEYARNAAAYHLLPDLAISCDGPVHSVRLFSRRPITESRRRHGAAQLVLAHLGAAARAPLPPSLEGESRASPPCGPRPPTSRRWRSSPTTRCSSSATRHSCSRPAACIPTMSTWARHGRTGPGCRSSSPCGPRAAAPTRRRCETPTPGSSSPATGDSQHLDLLADQAWATTGIDRQVCRDYLGDLDYRFSYRHLAGLTDFFRRLAQDGLVPDGSLSFISAA